MTPEARAEPFNRSEHCRRIASSGGRATVAKHGTALMSANGRRGFQALTERLGDRGQAVNLLRKRGVLPVIAFDRPRWEPVPEPAGTCGRVRIAEAA